MRVKQIIRQIFTRMTFILFFGLLCAAFICFALGVFELPAIELPWDVDIITTEASVKTDITNKPTDPDGTTQSPTVTTGSPDITSAPITEEPITDITTKSGDDPVTPTDDIPLLKDQLAKGYKISWNSWSSGMTLAKVFSNGYLPLEQTLGNSMKYRSISTSSYQSAGIEFNSFVTSTAKRSSVELYMGYIIVDTGIGTGTEIIAKYTETKNTDGSVSSHRVDRAKQTNIKTVTIYSSAGKAIGTYIADRVIPAYTRDAQNRALFWYNNNYYYIDEGSGDFILSDYIDERDNRGLYFDYNPDYGTTDSKIKRYDIYTDVTLKFSINSYYVYTRNQIDVRLARQMYIDFPSYAKTVANHNATFKHFYTIAKAAVDSERKASTAAVTTVSPETVTTITPEVTSNPAGTVETSAATSADITSQEVTTIALPTLSNPESAGTSTDVITTPVSPESESAVTTSSPQDEQTTVPSSADSSDLVTTEAPVEKTTAPVTTQKNYTIDISVTIPSYRFAYGTSQPKVDLNYITTMKYTVAPYVNQSGSWASAYKYAQAYNFRENRALTVDDNGVVKIINTSGGTVAYVNSYVTPEYYSGGKLHRYYILPSARDISMLGHFYYDHGLIRVIRAQTSYLAINSYYSREDILLDTSGNEYTIPSGFELVSYSEGILILEKNGLYGCYNKTGYWVADPVYTSAQPFVEGLCVLGTKDGLYGAIDTQGNIVLPFAYKSITNASSGLVACFSDTDGWTVFAKVTK